MDMHCKFSSLNITNFSLSPKEVEKLVRKNCNDFLKTREGLSHLCMKYSNLFLSEAINKYINNALWIDSIV